MKFKEHDCVRNIKGHPFREGAVVAAFQTLKGEDRYVVESVLPDTVGALSIFNEDQLEQWTPPAEAEKDTQPADPVRFAADEIINRMNSRVRGFVARMKR